MKKKMFAVLLSAMLVASLGACSSAETSSSTPESSAPAVSAVDAEEASEASSEVEPTPEPINLDGTWVQINNASEDSYQEAVISGDTITVNWVTASTDTKSLYWAGSVEIPENAGDSFSWDSQNDTEQTQAAIMASGDDTKTFTYENGQISYDVSAMGMTQTVRLEKAD